ncbi:MAG: hypothetical protein V3V31_08035 [Methylococcales bacterium]
MRFWAIKIVVLLGVTACQPAIRDKEYNVAFDVRKSRLPPKHGAIISDSQRSAASWRIGMQALLLPSFLKGSGELIYGGFNENSNAGFSERDKYLLKLGVSGNRNIFGYGSNFYSVGRRYEGKFDSKYRHKRGRTGYDSWLSWDIKDLQVKTKFSESWTNNLSSIYHIRTMDRWYEVETSYPFSSEPYTEISLSYGIGKRLRTSIPNHATIYEGPLNSVKTSFRFDDDSLKFTTGVSQFSSRNELDARKAFQQRIFYINGTLFPQYLLSVISSYRYSVSNYSSTIYKRRLNKIESSLGLIYKSKELPALKLTSAYKNYHSDDGLTDRDIVNFGAQIDWESWERYTGLKTDWTVDLRFRDIRDYVNPTTNSSDWSFNLLWRWPLS